MEDPVRVPIIAHIKADRWIDGQLLTANDSDFSDYCGDSLQGGNASFRLELDLREALQRHALFVQYQPQYDLNSGRGCGVEAFARWVLSTGVVISPSVFIPLAERAHMIHTLGAWVLEAACETASAWCSCAAQPTTLSVNVSALQIDQEFCSVIARTLEQSGFPAQQLELEIHSYSARHGATVGCRPPVRVTLASGNRMHIDRRTAARTSHLLFQEPADRWSKYVHAKV
jgi:EAL domain